mmetsp:Transcript_110047/g.295372  ORF Transcript_110047/g.295372 Transcript_110047/m.295372 type:complete len:209 (-) Transcript_110047:719-1345(-)
MGLLLWERLEAVQRLVVGCLLGGPPLGERLHGGLGVGAAALLRRLRDLGLLLEPGGMRLVVDLVHFEREPDEELRPLILLALYGQRAPVLNRDLPADGQAQAEPFVPARGGLVLLVERLKDTVHVLRSDADAGISDDDADLLLVIVRRGSDLHEALVGEFESIGYQVVDELSATVRICLNVWQINVSIDELHAILHELLAVSVLRIPA